ncbi:hypothetical protein EXN66_Car000602 [Channa argus]|uniref:Uncharacterized protein n=1 Tax=Channa argus TaxID=215402 RepID=A0A6G1QYN9_CHAAH|nr:hypothetical protein EXN66_Car000602 [Channa argus]
MCKSPRQSMWAATEAWCSAPSSEHCSLSLPFLRRCAPLSNCLWRFPVSVCTGRVHCEAHDPQILRFKGVFVNPDLSG